MASGKRKVFLDSNVLPYLLSGDAVRADSATRSSVYRCSTRSSATCASPASHVAS